MNLNNIKKGLELVERHTDALKQLVLAHQKIIILGNGGSSAIASHMAEDYTKALGKRAITFSDPSRLTCYANDYGYDNAYQMFLEHFADKDTLVILISSSGNSQNIVNCATFCVGRGIKFVSLTGFSPTNRLNCINAELQFHFESEDYGEVECLHQIFLHNIL